jgi:hypothetical protein
MWNEMTVEERAAYRAELIAAYHAEQRAAGIGADPRSDAVT